MKRGMRVSAVLLLLLASSGCSMTKFNPVNLSWFEKKPTTCDLAHQAEYARAMEEATSVLSQSTQASQEEESPPGRKVEKATEEAVVHQFVIKNTGNDVLKITNVISNCGSSVGRHTQSIPPGKEGVVTIKLKPGACEESDVKSAIIVTNDTQKPAIAVKVKNAKGS